MQTRRRTTSAVHARSAPVRCLPCFAEHPAIRVPVEDIAAERHWIAALATASGVPPSDREDLVQAVMLAAWRAVEAGRYRPAPSVNPRRALRGWLQGIVWRTAGRHRERAWVRREIPVADPWSLRPEPPQDDALRIEAHERLLDVRLVVSERSRRDGEMLALAAAGHSVRAIAHTLGMPISTAARQLSRARRRLRVLLAR